MKTEFFAFLGALFTCKIQFHARIHSHASREGTVYDLNIIVFSNLQKHSMNFKFLYKWILFMPNEHFTRKARRGKAKRSVRAEAEAKAKREEEIF